LRNYVSRHDENNQVYAIGDACALELRADVCETDSLLFTYFFEQFCAEHPGEYSVDVGVVAKQGLDVQVLARKAREQFARSNVDSGKIPASVIFIR